MVKHIVDSNLEKTLNNGEIELTQIKLLDPACGAGNFLVYAFDKLLSLYNGKISSELNFLASIVSGVSKIDIW